LPVIELRRSEPDVRQIIGGFFFPNTIGASLFRMVAAAWLIRMTVVAFVFRGLPDPARGFEQFGWEMGWVARSIATGHGFASPFLPMTGPTALVPPGFPYLLAGIFRVFGVYSPGSGLAVLSLDALFSALTCIPVYLIARDAVGDRTARIAGWAWVVYPFSIYYSTVVWEWALTALLFTTCLWLLLQLHTVEQTWKWAGFGLLYGATALVNPSVLSVLPFLLAITLWRRHRVGQTWFVKAAVTALTVIAVLVPWTVRTYRTMHVLVPVRDNYWLEFYAGNTGDGFESNAAWAHPASNPAEMTLFEQQGETAYLAGKHRLALEFVANHPGWFAMATVRRVVRYWTGFWSFNAWYLHKEPFDVPNLFFCSAITVLMLRGAARLWRVDRESAMPLLTLIAVFPVTYYLSHASMDYRQPIEPVIVILAVTGVFGFGGRRPDEPQGRRRSASREVAYELAG